MGPFCPHIKTTIPPSLRNRRSIQRNGSWLFLLPPPFCSSSSLLPCSGSHSSATCWALPGDGHCGHKVLYIQPRLREAKLDPEVHSISSSAGVRTQGHYCRVWEPPGKRQRTNEGTKLLPVSGAKTWPRDSPEWPTHPPWPPSL